MTMAMEHKPVGAMLEAVPRQPKIKRSQYQASGRFPIVDQSQSDIAGYTDDESELYQGDLPVVIFGDHTRVLKFVDFPFCVGADGTQLLRPVAGNDIRYFYYALRNIDLANYGYERHFKYLKGEEVPVPPLPTQRRIASILSAYDELIENNQRRIRILEDMARSLYREWFVHFSYPCHESIPLVDSPLGQIPKGWEVTTLGTQLAALESGKRPKGGIKDVDDGVPSIGAENINGIGNHNFSGEKFIPREFFESMRKGVVCDRDVAIYKDGAYIGKSSYFRDGFPHAECCVNEHVFLLRSSGIRLKQNALYLWLQEPDTVHAIRATNANAAQPGINQQSVGGLNLVVPDEKTAANFDRLVEPLLAEIIGLAKKIQNLRSTRDLLLPRLLSGQVPLTEIEQGGGL